MLIITLIFKLYYVYKWLIINMWHYIYSYFSYTVLVSSGLYFYVKKVNIGLKNKTLQDLAKV